MSNERFYTVDPINVDGEGFTLEGLQSVLDKISETWGGKAHNKATVSPAMTLGGGAAIIAVENGRVMIIRDDVARDIARRRAEQEQEPDGRVKTFHATATIMRLLGTAKSAAEEVATKEIVGEGLMGLMFNVAMYVQDVLGDVPECMSYAECERREKGFRAQISRARGQDRDTAGFHFPSSDIASFFEVGTNPGVYYRVVVSVYVSGTPAEKLAQTLEQAFPELPRRA